MLIANKGVLPLSGEPRVYVDGLAYDGAVMRPEDAEAAIVRRNAPFEPRTNGIIETLFHAGDLDFKGGELDVLVDLAQRAPTVLVLHLERPAVIPELVAACSAVVAVFGASDEAALDVLFGRTEPEGRLPFELPSSMAAVREQLPDVPGDSRDPLFVFGHGLRYAA
jgi:beta-glucosidase